MSALDYITINGTQINKPPKFAPARVDVYKGEYTTCTGKTIADRVGWKYEDMTLEWDALPQNMVDALIAMDAGGVSTITFDSPSGATVTENIIRASAVAVRYRQTVGGVTYWKDVKLSIRFIDAHTDMEIEEIEDA